MYINKNFQSQCFTLYDTCYLAFVILCILSGYSKAEELCHLQIEAHSVKSIGLYNYEEQHDTCSCVLFYREKGTLIGATIIQSYTYSEDGQLEIITEISLEINISALYINYGFRGLNEVQLNNVSMSIDENEGVYIDISKYYFVHCALRYNC